MRNYLLFFNLLLLLSSCRVLQESPKYKFNDGVYTTKLEGSKRRVYIENTDDSILVYRLDQGRGRVAPTGTLPPKPQAYPSKASLQTVRTNKYWKNTFDVDILTMPFKFRPAIRSFSRQLSNHLNGALYLGYRNDTYELSYKQNPIGKINQRIAHLGFSAGIITGIGVTPLNPWVTQNNITVEYDGFIWCKGLCWIMAVDKLNFGLALGIDHLLDENREYWIYHGKPYLGLTVGLNLN